MGRLDKSVDRASTLPESKLHQIIVIIQWAKRASEFQLSSYIFNISQDFKVNEKFMK